MVGYKRVSVVLSLAGYLLATTSVHWLHDHSAAAGCCDAAGPAGHECCQESADACPCHQGTHEHADHNSPHRPPCPPRNCEDTCSACRLMAVKSIAPVVVVAVPWIAPLYQAETPRLLIISALEPNLPLSRGPPCA